MTKVETIDRKEKKQINKRSSGAIDDTPMNDRKITREVKLQTELNRTGRGQAIAGQLRMKPKGFVTAAAGRHCDQIQTHPIVE